MPKNKSMPSENMAFKKLSIFEIIILPFQNITEIIYDHSCIVNEAKLKMLYLLCYSTE